MQINRTLRTVGAALLATSALAAVQPAAATSVFSSSVDALLFMVDVESSTGEYSGLAINGSDFYTEFQDGAGNFMADPGGNVNYLVDPLGLGFGFDLSLTTFSDGAAQPAGFVEQSALNFGFVDLINSSADTTFELSYALSYTLDTEVSVDFGGIEDAFSNASLQLRQDQGSLFSSFVSADVLLGPPSDSDSGLFLFSVLLNPGDTVSLTVQGSAFGVAEAIPVPAALPMLGTALFALFGFARRRFA